MIIPVRLENRHRKQRRDFRECQRDLQVRIPAIIESGCQKLRTRLRKTGGNLEFYSSRVGAFVECRFRKHRKEHTDWTQAIQELKPAIRFRQNGKTVQAMLEERIEKTDGRMAKGENKFRVFVCSDSGNVGKQRSNPLYQTET